MAVLSAAKRGKMGVGVKFKITSLLCIMGALVLFLSLAVLVNSQPVEFCNDGTCNNGEDCSSCPSDCGACQPACGTPGAPACQPTPPSPPTSGAAIYVKMDLGEPDELQEFYLGEGGQGCEIRATETDHIFDDHCSAKGNTWSIIKTNGRLSDSTAFYYGGCDDDAKTVIQKQFNNYMSNACGTCSLNGGGYMPKGELLCAGDGRWYLCDQSYNNGQDKVFEKSGKKYTCKKDNTWVEGGTATPGILTPSQASLSISKGSSDTSIKISDGTAPYTATSADTTKVTVTSSLN